MYKILVFSVLALAVGGCYFIQPQPGTNITVQTPSQP